MNEHDIPWQLDPEDYNDMPGPMPWGWDKDEDEE